MRYMAETPWSGFGSVKVRMSFFSDAAIVVNVDELVGLRWILNPLISWPPCVQFSLTPPPATATVTDPGASEEGSQVAQTFDHDDEPPELRARTR